METEDFKKEKARRGIEDSVFTCLCGKVLIGKNVDYNEHLKYCPVILDAKRNLSTSK